MLGKEIGKEMNTISKATRICKQLAEQVEYELVEVAFDHEPAGWYLRIYLDNHVGISLDDCEKYHRAIQPLLEDLDYDFLEVCSPGADRPIKTERDAKQCTGLQVEIKLYKPYKGKKVYVGTFCTLTDEGYAIETTEGRMFFPRKDVAVAKRVLDLENFSKAINTD